MTYSLLCGKHSYNDTRICVLFITLVVLEHKFFCSKFFKQKLNVLNFF